MLVALDVGFGYTKTVTAAGVDVSPSVVGEWTPGTFRLGADLGDGRDARESEAVGLDGRAYVATTQRLSCHLDPPGFAGQAVDRSGDLGAARTHQPGQSEDLPFSDVE